MRYTKISILVLVVLVLVYGLTIVNRLQSEKRLFQIQNETLKTKLEIKDLQAKIENAKLETLKNNSVPVTKFVDCWNNQNNKTTIKAINQEKLSDENYCLVIPDSSFDF